MHGKEDGGALRIHSNEKKVGSARVPRRLACPILVH